MACGFTAIDCVCASPLHTGRWTFVSPWKSRFLFLSWLLTDDGVEHRNVFKSNNQLYHRICLTINKIVYYQHLLVSFEELLSLRLSDHLALVVGCFNNN